MQKDKQKADGRARARKDGRKKKEKMERIEGEGVRSKGETDGGRRGGERERETEWETG